MAQIAKDPQVQICALFADKRWVSAKKVDLPSTFRVGY